jgi:hypothetical protein
MLWNKPQYKALKAVNRELIKLGWGKSVVETLSKDLQNEVPGFRVFLPEISGKCGRFTLNIRTMKNCNHWLQKLAGVKIS